MPTLHSLIERLLQRTLSPYEAFERWAEHYDDEDGNLLLRLDESLMKPRFDGEFFRGKDILDFGCGTGRYWGRLLLQQPRSLTGLDISPSMIAKLKRKFPDASAFVIESCGEPSGIPPGRFDIILCNLTLDYVRNPEGLFSRWSEWLRPSGEILLTDLHPETFDKGAGRSFSSGRRTLRIAHERHSLAAIRLALQRAELKVIEASVKHVDEGARRFFEDETAFRQWESTPAVYSLRAVKACRP